MRFHHFDSYSWVRLVSWLAEWYVRLDGRVQTESGIPGSARGNVLFKQPGSMDQVAGNFCVRLKRDFQIIVIDFRLLILQFFLSYITQSGISAYTFY